MIPAMFGCCKNDRCGLRRKMKGAPHSSGDGQILPPSGPDVLRKAAADFRLSTGETLAEAAESRMLVLVFLRHFGCTFTRQILRGLEEIQNRAHARGAELILVHMLKSGEEIQYLAAHSDVVRIADPQCQLYRAFGLGKGGVLELFGPRVWWLAFVSIFKGCGVGHLAGDGRQMPGAFIFHKGQIIASQPAKSASDLPDLSALFAAVTQPEIR
jgi:hypothetical protein